MRLSLPKDSARSAARRAFLIASLVVAMAVPATGQTVTQNFTLQPGWNAIFLEVQPLPDDPASVFGTIPGLRAVWMWNGRQAGREFVKDANEAVLIERGWLSWFPDPSQTFLSSLHAVVEHRAFLINVGGGDPVSWSVTGVPSTRSLRWIPDSLNLMGLRIDPANKPTFASYLASSAAHAGRPVYRLDAAGTWQPVAAGVDRIEPGIAYWFDIAGPSTFQGPIAISLDSGDSLEFGQTLSERFIRATAARTFGGTVSLRILSAPNVVPLHYWRFGSDGIAEWPALPNSLNVVVSAGSSETVRMAVDRSSLPAERADSILEVTTSRGGRWLIPVGASRTNSTESILTSRGRIQSTAVFANAGLWVGTVTVDKVSNARNASTTPLPAPAPFPLRLIVHVDEGGSVKLLKEVIQMWQNGVGSAPGRYVLLTLESLASSFTGASLRNGVPVARRVSSIGYDFDGSSNDNQLPLSGAFEVNGILTGTIELARDFPTNPFRHKFHPDHDNSDPATAFDIQRSITLELSASDPEGGTLPGWGDSWMGGIYKETIAAAPGGVGLHKNPIYVEGTFRLQRVSLVNVLNQ